MNTLLRALNAGRELGWGALLHYARYQAALKSGLLQRQTPVYDWIERPASWWVDRKEYKPLGQFFYEEHDLAAIRALAVPASAIETVREIANGRFSLFGLPAVQLSSPPDWWAYPPLAEAQVNDRIPLDQHWAGIDVGQLQGDVKPCWELSRLGWTFALIRAYTLTGESSYIQNFMDLLHSWRRQNRPNNGIHWVSAQEVALRILPLCLAAYAFQPALNDIPGAHETILQTVAVHAARIPPSLAYARAQNNNHLLSEAAGLLTAGLVYPQLKYAKAWTNLGRRLFVQGIDRQVFKDGGYIQQSTNYHRLALQLGLWVAQLTEANNLPLPDRTRQQLTNLTTALGDLVDPISGQVPNFGPNDGAWILPLSGCGFMDYRPTLQAAYREFHNRNAFPPGQWDEESRWFGLPDMQSADHASKPPAQLPEYGLHLLRGSSTWGLLRAAHFNSRPGHSDQLQVDLWRRGENLVRDAGTYLYNGQPPWDNRLSAAAVHNNGLVDGQEPMQRAGRFLWLDWDQAECRLRESSSDGQLEGLAAERSGFRQLGVMQRRVLLRAGETTWLVIDDLSGSGRHSLQTGWLLPDGEWELRGETLHLSQPEPSWRIESAGFSEPGGLYRAGENIGGQPLVDDPVHLGWFSWTYAFKEPALHWVTRVEGELPLRVFTWFTWDEGTPKDLTLHWEDNRLQVEWRGSQLELRFPSAGEKR